MAKIKERKLKVGESNWLCIRELPLDHQLNFQQKKLQSRREWHNVFKVIIGKNLQPGTLTGDALIQI